MLFPGGFTFPNFLADVFSIFIFVLWFWLLITVFGDLFRRRDISGLGKVIWVIVLVVFPYLGVFIYLITQGRGMAERQNQRAQQARDELRQVVGFSVADELEKLERLKNSNAISNDEYARLRARAVQYTETGFGAPLLTRPWLTRAIPTTGRPVDWDAGHSLETTRSSRPQRGRLIYEPVPRTEDRRIAISSICGSTVDGTARARRPASASRPGVV